jgi:hypothetical protein
VDIGAASGSCLLAISNLGCLSQGFLVDPFWTGYYNEYLRYYKMDKSYYQKRSIQIINADGLDEKVREPLLNADLVVKTYCYPAPDWDVYLPNTKAQWFLSDDCNKELLEKLGLEVVYSFHLDESDEFLKEYKKFHGDRKPYLLARRKKQNEE